MVDTMNPIVKTLKGTIRDADTNEIIIFMCEYQPVQGDLYTPYYRKQGDIRCQVSCSHCKHRAQKRGMATYRCEISGMNCKRGWKFCDFHDLDDSLYRDMWRKGWRNFPVTGGWMAKTDFIPDIASKPPAPIVPSTYPPNLIEWVK